MRFTIFELKLNRLLCIKEDIDSFLAVIENPNFDNFDALRKYLQSSTPDELEDWVSALEIAVLDREQMTRWTLALAKFTYTLPLSAKSKPIVAGILEALNVPDYASEQGV